MHRASSRFSFLVPFALIATLGACASSSSPSEQSCGERRCSAGVPTGSPKGIAADKSVAVTAVEAWPNRGAEPPTLTAQELAEACALISPCKSDPLTGKALDDDGIAALTQACAKGKSSGDAKEERAILQEGQNERFAFEARAVLALPVASRDCKSIAAIATKRPSVILCQEDGCWWESPTPARPACCQPVPTVTCAGDVATLVTEGLTFSRDCSRAFAKCDPKSSTGCTDRAPVGCDPAALDKCDGDVKLGCDSAGRVSFHDCARYPGGHCIVVGTDVKCQLDDDKCDLTKLGCDAAAPNNLNVCVLGKTVTVDCAAIGMGACTKGHCTPKAI
jgi:hypothetical protein